MISALPRLMALVACLFSSAAALYSIVLIKTTVDQPLPHFRFHADMPKKPKKVEIALKPNDPLAPRQIASTDEGGVMVGLDEIFVNIDAETPNVPAHSLALRVDLEIFSEDVKELVEQRQSGIKDTIIEVSREQGFQTLSTLAGKLYFKEILVGRINQFLGQAAIRDIHFFSFYLQ